MTFRRSPALFLALAWALLSFHGGLHPQQWVLAVALGLLALGSAAATAWTLAERWVLLVVLSFSIAGAGVAELPQAHVNASVALMLCLALGAALRRDAAWTPSRAAQLSAVLGSLAALAFLGIGYLGRGYYHGAELSGPVVMPHLAAHWIAPNQNLLGGGLVVPAMLVFFAWALQGRRWAWAGALLGAAAIVYAGSRGVYLSLGAALAWFLLRLPRRSKALRGAALLAGLITMMAWKAPFSRLAHRMEEQAQAAEKDDNFFRRTDFWKGAARLSLQAPWLGHGLGSFEVAARRLDLPTPLTERLPITRYRLLLDHAHNEWLESAVESGWPWTLLLAGLICAWLWRRWCSAVSDPLSLALEAVVVGALCLSLVDMNLRTPGIFFGLMMVVAALEPLSASPSVAAPAWQRRGTWALAIVALLLALGTWAGRPAHGTEPSSLRLKAALWLQPADAQAALRAEQAGLASLPWSDAMGATLAEWQFWRAAVAAQQGDFGLAVSRAQRGSQLRPYWAPGWFFLAQYQAQAGQSAAVAAAMDQAADLEPNFARVWAWRCDQALARQDRPEALRCLNKVEQIQTLKIQRESPDPYSLFIQSIPADWLKSRHAQLFLSTSSHPQS